MPELVGYELHEPNATLRRTARPLRRLNDGEVLVQVAGCGLCHTDLGFAYGGVRTRHGLPLILGHEISGFVVEASHGHEALVGQAVVVPAVIPCGVCADCLAGLPMICRRQVMPGNDADGGFATHVYVPARGLCPVPGAKKADQPLGASGVTLRQLAVIADAVSTPYQAVRRAGVEPGDLAIVVGLGGVGGYAAQLAKIAGAVVIGLDVDPGRRARAAEVGCFEAFDPREKPIKELRAAIGGIARETGARPNRWKIFECSGVSAGQATAFSLVNHGATLMVVGFTMDELPLRLSNLMAFDARAIGNWGCAPEHYPAIVDLAIAGELALAPFTRVEPLSTLPGLFEAAHHASSDRRLVFAPDL